MTDQRRPQLGSAASVVEVPDPDAAQTVPVDQVVFESQRGDVVPVELSCAAERGVEPGVPPLPAGGIVGVPVHRVAPGAHGGVRGLPPPAAEGVRPARGGRQKLFAPTTPSPPPPPPEPPPHTPSAP